MLGFFPSSYPDELLYSLIARYHIRSGNLSPKMTLQELFNSRGAIATADLPCNLTALATNLSFLTTITAEDLVHHHTLYPFYAPFLPEDRAKQVFEAMQSGRGGSIHDTVGIRASLVRVPSYFRFCPQCLQADQQQYGEPYWHRIHQLPGVLVCPHHGEVLQDSSVPTRGLNRHEYCAASDHTCVISATSHSFSDNALEHLRSLAQDVQFLLTTALPSREMNWFSRQYTNRLIERGLATATGRVDQRQLKDEFLYFYGHSLLDALDSAVCQDGEQSWLTCIVRKHRKVFHPIRHLLMMRFLGMSVQEIMGAERPYAPFGSGPWLCLNAAADHYLHRVVTQLDISHCGDTKKPVGTFSCACGFVYCRTGPDKTEEDAHRIGKIKAVGKVWQQKLRHYVEIEQLGLRATARHLQVDPRTVRRYVKLLDLFPHWSSSQSEREVEPDVPQSPISYSDTLKHQHRDIWKSLQREHPQATKTMLRRQAPSTYTWLYRHDRDWLTQNSPSPCRPIPQAQRVDWPQRDKDILTLTQQAVERLLAEEKPVQVTISRVAKMVSHLSLIEQHLDQMLLTQTYLESVVETTEAFQIRRVRWAAEQLERQGEVALPWKIIRMARLKPGYSEEVEKAIAQTYLLAFTSTPEYL